MAGQFVTSCYWEINEYKNTQTEYTKVKNAKKVRLITMAGQFVTSCYWERLQLEQPAEAAKSKSSGCQFVVFTYLEFTFQFQSSDFVKGFQFSISICPNLE